MVDFHVQEKTKYTDQSCPWQSTASDFNEAFALCRSLLKGCGPEIMLIQDLSGSYWDDLVTLNQLIRGFGIDLSSMFGSIRFGLASYVDNPHYGGSGSDYQFALHQKITSDWACIEQGMARMRVLSGGDGPESQLDALLALAKDPITMGFSASAATKIVILTTDAGYHQAGDAIHLGPNLGTGEFCASQDYPSVAQVKAALEEANISPIFFVTSNVMAVYMDLTEMLGRGTVVELSSNSVDISTGVRTGACALGNVPEVSVWLELVGTTEDGFKSGSTRLFAANAVARSAGCEYGMVTTIKSVAQGIQVNFVVIVPSNDLVESSLAQLKACIAQSSCMLSSLREVSALAGLASVGYPNGWGEADSIQEKTLKVSSATCDTGEFQVECTADAVVGCNAALVPHTILLRCCIGVCICCCCLNRKIAELNRKIAEHRASRSAEETFLHEETDEEADEEANEEADEEDEE
jgi:hypothetical protein